MINSKNKVNLIFFRNFINLVFSIIVFFSISIKKSEALPHEWVGVPKSEYGEQLWDRQSIKRNEDGSVRVLSKYIPKKYRIYFILSINHDYLWNTNIFYY